MIYRNTRNQNMGSKIFWYKILSILFFLLFLFLFHFEFKQYRMSSESSITFRIITGILYTELCSNCHYLLLLLHICVCSPIKKNIFNNKKKKRKKISVWRKRFMNTCLGWEWKWSRGREEKNFTNGTFK